MVKKKKTYYGYFTFENRDQGHDNYLGYISIIPLLKCARVSGCCKLPENGKVSIYVPAYINGAISKPLYGYAEDDSIMGCLLSIKNLKNLHEYHLTLTELEGVLCMYHPIAFETPDELIALSDVIDKTYIKGFLRLIEENPLLKVKKGYSNFYNKYKNF